MFRYLAGLVLVQMITIGLLVLNVEAEPRALALQAGLPALAVALLAALWFRSLSRADAERDLARTRLDHERERERLRREAERERLDITREAERTVRREERRTGRRANVKVGLAFAATAGMGVLFVISELVTLGLLTLTTGGGALGGYLLRWRQTRAIAHEAVHGPAPDGPRARPIEPPEAGTPSVPMPPPEAPGDAAPLALPAPSASDERAESTSRARVGRRRAAPGRAV